MIKLIAFLTIIFSCCFIVKSQESHNYTIEFDKLMSAKSYAEKFKILEDTCLFSSNYNKALYCSEQYLELAKDSHDKKHIASGYRLIGRTYWLQGKVSISQENLFKALQLYQEINDTYGLAKTSISIGVNYAYQQEYDKALKYYLEAGEKFETLGDDLGLAQAYLNSSEMYLCKNDSKKSLEEVLEALKRYKIHSMKVGNGGPDSNMGVAMCLGKMAELHKASGELDSALYIYNQALKIERNINHKHGIAGLLLTITEILVELKQFQESEKLALEALQISKEIGSIELTSYSLRDLALINKGLNRFEIALNYFEQYQAVRDTIVTYDARAISAKFELKNAETDYKISSELKDTKQTYTYIVASIIVLFLLIIAYVIFNRYTITKKLNAQLAESNATKNKLFAIISHDLKGPLSAFSELSNILSHNRNSITEEKRTKIMENMHTSSLNILGLLDNLLSWSRSQMKGYKLYPELINLHELVSEVSDSIADLAIAKQINILNVIDENTEITADRNALEMVIRNLISNAIKFSYQGGNIEIRSQCLNVQTEISVSDSGIGLDETVKTSLFKHSSNKSTMGTNMEKGTGLGLVICKDIIELHGGRIWAEPNDETGTTFKFTIE